MNFVYLLIRTALIGIGLSIIGAISESITPSKGIAKPSSNVQFGLSGLVVGISIVLINTQLKIFLLPLILLVGFYPLAKKQINQYLPKNKKYQLAVLFSTLILLAIEGSSILSTTMIILGAIILAVSQASIVYYNPGKNDSLVYR